MQVRVGEGDGAVSKGLLERDGTGCEEGEGMVEIRASS